jgi:hypothetical protein
MNAKFFPLLMLLLFLQLAIKAQCINGVKSYPIYKMGAKFVDAFDNEGAEIVRIEYDLVFSSKETFRNLTSDWEYSIIGFADDGVKELGIKLYEYDDLLDRWTLVKEAASEDAYTMVAHRPSQTGMYKVEVIVDEFHPGYTAARYGLMFVHE